jgi:hypothetical protein
MAARIEANRPKRRIFVLFTFYWLQNSNTGTAAGIEANWPTKNKKISVFVLFTFYWRQNSKNKRTKNLLFLFCLHFSADMARLQQHDKLAKKHKKSSVFVFVLFTFYWRQCSLPRSKFLEASFLKQVPQSEFLKAP